MKRVKWKRQQCVQSTDYRYGLIYGVWWSVLANLQGPVSRLLVALLLYQPIWNHPPTSNLKMAKLGLLWRSSLESFFGELPRRSSPKSYFWETLLLKFPSTDTRTNKDDDVLKNFRVASSCQQLTFANLAKVGQTSETIKPSAINAWSNKRRRTLSGSGYFQSFRFDLDTASTGWIPASSRFSRSQFSVRRWPYGSSCYNPDSKLVFWFQRILKTHYLIRVCQPFFQKFPEH